MNFTTKVRILLTTFLLALITSGVGLAKEVPITINFQDNFLDYKGLTQFEIEYDLPPRDAKFFTIKPKISRGQISIYNDETQTWVVENDLWTKMPRLKEKMQLKISALGNQSTYIYFQIQNQKTGKIFETDHKEVWPYDSFKPYISIVNKNINSWVLKTTEESLTQKEEAPQDPTPNSTMISRPNFPKKYLLLYLFIFTLSAIAGFIFNKRKMIDLHNVD